MIEKPIVIEDQLQVLRVMQSLPNEMQKEWAHLINHDTTKAFPPCEQPTDSLIQVACYKDTPEPNTERTLFIRYVCGPNAPAAVRGFSAWCYPFHIPEYMCHQIGVSLRERATIFLELPKGFAARSN